MATTECSSAKGRRANAAVSGPAPEQGSGRAEAPSDPELLAELGSALRAAAEGDLSIRLAKRWRAAKGEVAPAFNDIAGHNQKLSKPVDLVQPLSLTRAWTYG